MIFDIDTINEKADIILLDDNFKEIGRKSISDKFQVAEKVLPVADELMEEHGCNLSMVSAILVNLGPGSYTGQRIGVTTANLIAFSLSIPVVGYKNNERNTTINLLKRDGIDQKFSLVAPLYSSAPTITKKC